MMKMLKIIRATFQKVLAVTSPTIGKILSLSCCFHDPVGRLPGNGPFSFLNHRNSVNKTHVLERDSFSQQV